MKIRSVLSILCAASLALGTLSGCAAGTAKSDAQSGATTKAAGISEAAAPQDGALIVRVQSVDGSTIMAAVGTIAQGAGLGGGGAQGGNGAQGSPGDAGQGDGNGQGGQQGSSGQQPEGTPPAMPQNGAQGGPGGAGQGDGNRQGGQQGNGGQQNGSDGQQPEDTPPAMPQDGAQGGAGQGDGNGQGNQQGSGGQQNGSDGQQPDGTPPAAAQNGLSSGQQGGDQQGNGPGNGGGLLFTESGETVTFTVGSATVITVQSGNESAAGTLADIGAGDILEVVLADDNTAETIVVRSFRGGMPGSAFGGGQADGEVTNGTAATTLTDDATIDGETYASSGDDENALRIDGATVTLSNITVQKTGGSSSNTENGDFYGTNAGLLAQNGATVTIQGASVTTNAVNGNGVFSYGSGTTVNISNSTIRTSERNSGGIQTTGGGTMNAQNLTVETQGASSAAIRSDRGGGSVNVDGGTYVTNGTGSPAIYSTAAIQVQNATLTANASEAVVVEGKNGVELTDCTLVGNMAASASGSENVHNIMLYQSMSGDAEVGHSSFTATGGSITAKQGDMFYVTNTTCTISLTNVALTLANETLLTVAGNTSARGWGEQGKNGGSCTFAVSSQQLAGAINVDAISSLKLTLADGSAFSGTINASGAAGEVVVTLGDGCRWVLTGDSYISSFTGDVSNIVTNGFTVYAGGEAITK